MLIGLVALLSTASDPPVRDRRNRDTARVIATKSVEPGYFGGTFRLSNGETIVGGPFAERQGSDPLFLYINPDKPSRVGLFRRSGPASLTSVLPEGIHLRFDGKGPYAGEVSWDSREASLKGMRIRPYREQNISIAGSPSPARLLVPACKGPHPLVVMVGGSGPSTRWGGFYDTFFASLGMAVLTYDKRPAQTGAFREPNLEDLARDAAAALAFARSLPSVDRSRVGFWATSQGGWVAPMAMQWARPDFLIVRVGPGVSERESEMFETYNELIADGMSAIDASNATALRRRVYQLAESGMPIAEADHLSERYRANSWYEKAFGKGKISDLLSAGWWKWAAQNLSVEPTRYLMKSDTPTLWFLAEKDENVPPVESQLALTEAFSQSPGPDETIVVLPGVNHAFLAQSPGGTPQFTDGYFPRVRTWLEERKLSNDRCWGRVQR